VCMVDTEKQTWRLIVLHSDAPRLLVFGNGKHSFLPSVEIPRGGRVTAKLNAQLKAAWNLDTFCLHPLRSEDSRDSLSVPGCYVAETVRRDGTAPETARWLPITAFRDQSFLQDDEAAIRKYLNQTGNTTLSGSGSPVGLAGSFTRVRSWVEEMLRSSDTRLEDKFLQINASRGFSLVRFETNHGAVWFKAVGEPNLREFSITTKLAAWFPDCIPQILAVEPQWSGWLSAEAPGEPLWDICEATAWERAATAFAALQIASVPHISDLVASGSRRVGFRQLLLQVDPFCAEAERIAAELQTLPEERTGGLGNELRDTLRSLEDLGFPETLVHLDFNPGNIILSSQRCMFLDWAEAAVGHPFLSFEYFRQYARRAFLNDSVVDENITQAYAVPWRQLLPPDKVREAFSLVRVVAVFAYAVSLLPWVRQSGPSDFAAGKYMASLIRRLKRELSSRQSFHSSS
jgi:hypothetical protein